METRYERRLNYNSITRYLHSVRYAHLAAVVTQALAAKRGATLRILDIGCGAGKSFELANPLGRIAYTGVELRRKASFRARQRFGCEPNFRVINDAIQNRLDLLEGADLVIALETLEHIPHEDTLRLIEVISGSSATTFFCTVPNEVGPALAIKNIGSAVIGYNRHKEYSWKETFYASTYQLEKIPAHQTSHKGFDWRILKEQLEERLLVERILRSPSQFVPMAFSPSLGFLCRQSRGA